MAGGCVMDDLDRENRMHLRRSGYFAASRELACGELIVLVGLGVAACERQPGHDGMCDTVVFDSDLA